MRIASLKNALLTGTVAGLLVASMSAQTDGAGVVSAQTGAASEHTAPVRQELADARAAAPGPPTPSVASPNTAKGNPSGTITHGSDQAGVQEWPATLLGSHFRLYGQLRMDMDLDTYRPNNSETPLYVSSPDTAGLGHFSDYAIHPRLSRFGLDFTAPPMEGFGGGQLTGKIETDFENGGSESRQIIRIRHAYLKAAWKDFSLLGGQTWDVFSPLFPTVNNDTLMWNAGNVGDRRPQLRAAYEPKAFGLQWSVAAAVGLSGAIDSLDLDGNGVLDGQQSRVPNLQARVGLGIPSWVRHQSFSVGFSEFHSQSSTVKTVGGRTQFDSQAGNLDYTLPLTTRVSLRGEIWCGHNLADVRGGIGQGYNTALGRYIRSRGGWSELPIRVSRRWTVAPGVTADVPVASDLSKGYRRRNIAYYAANRFTIDRALVVGLDYLRWRTDYVASRTAVDNRINLFFQYGF